MEWRCPVCGLFAKGNLNMNGKAMEWLDAAWAAHIQRCRKQSAAPPSEPAQPNA